MTALRIIGIDNHFRFRAAVIRSELLRRSLVKAATYRLLIMALDFLTIYILTGAAGVSLGFVIASNVYTTLAYIGHERLWAHVQWGTRGSIKMT